MIGQENLIKRILEIELLLKELNTRIFNTDMVKLSELKACQMGDMNWSVYELREKRSKDILHNLKRDRADYQLELQQLRARLQEFEVVQQNQDEPNAIQLQESDQSEAVSDVIDDDVVLSIRNTCIAIATQGFGYQYVANADKLTWKSQGNCLWIGSFSNPILQRMRSKGQTLLPPLFVREPAYWFRIEFDVHLKTTATFLVSRRKSLYLNVEPLIIDEIIEGTSLRQ